MKPHIFVLIAVIALVSADKTKEEKTSEHADETTIITKHTSHDKTHSSKTTSEAASKAAPKAVSDAKQLLLDGVAYAIGTCRMNQIIDGYHYGNFYQVPADIRNSKPKGFKIRLVVYMKGPHDGNVLLSSSTNLDGPKIEIGKFCVKMKNVFMNIIGGTHNTVCNIRDKFGSPDCFVVTQTKNIMDPNKFLKVVIEVTNDHYVWVYTKEDRPLMVYHDKNQVPINFVSFSGYESTVQFYFGCGPR